MQAFGFAGCSHSPYNPPSRRGGCRLIAAIVREDQSIRVSPAE